MTITLWIINIILAIAFLGAGAIKVLQTRTALKDKGMAYVEDFSDSAIKAIGVAEILGALGLILPLATGIAPLLTPIAATALALVMVGASIVHLRRKENPIAAVVLMILSVASAILGFLVVA